MFLEKGIKRGLKKVGKWERLKINFFATLTLTFGELVQFIRYCVWNVWGKSFIGGWVVGRGRLGGSIWRGGMFN